MTDTVRHWMLEGVSRVDQRTAWRTSLGL